jgi:hypothetical protein
MKNKETLGELLFVSKNFIRRYKYNLQKVTCLGHAIKFKYNNSYLIGIVISISFDKVVVYRQDNSTSYSVKWCDILENLSI